MLHTTNFWLVSIAFLPSCIDVGVAGAYRTNPPIKNVNFEITPPMLRSDWTQMSKLMVVCLEEPTRTQSESSQIKIKDILWIVYQKYQAQQEIYRQLVQTARTMQDLKYSILVAKEQQEYGNGKVIGMIEFGVCVIRSNTSLTTSTTSSDYNAISAFDQNPFHRVLMIGTVTVDPQYRKKGIASALIHKCETVVHQQWKESEIYAHIEQTNRLAIQCFTKLGYSSITDTLSSRVDYISVRRRNKVECVPHMLFMKTL